MYTYIYIYIHIACRKLFGMLHAPRWDFSKVSSLVNVQYAMTSQLTFEKLYKGTQIRDPMLRTHVSRRTGRLFPLLKKKSAQLATEFSVYHNHGAWFWEFVVCAEQPEWHSAYGRQWSHHQKVGLPRNHLWLFSDPFATHSWLICGLFDSFVTHLWLVRDSCVTRLCKRSRLTAYVGQRSHKHNVAASTNSLVTLSSFIRDKRCMNEILELCFTSRVLAQISSTSFSNWAWRLEYSPKYHECNAHLQLHSMSRLLATIWGGFGK